MRAITPVFLLILGRREGGNVGVRGGGGPINMRWKGERGYGGGSITKCTSAVVVVMGGGGCII